MKHLLDADRAINCLNGRPNAVVLIERVADEGIAISTITCGEVYEGLVTRPSSAIHIAQFDQFVTNLDLIAPDTKIALRYARLRADLRAKGELIPDNDIWYAATALEHGLLLLTRDCYFERVPGVQVYRPDHDETAACGRQ